MARIIKALTETYTHDFLIPRDVAERIGLNVIRPKTDEETLIMKLYESYEDELRMNIPFDADAILAAHAPPPPPPAPSAQPTQPPLPVQPSLPAPTSPEVPQPGQPIGLTLQGQPTQIAQLLQIPQTPQQAPTPPVRFKIKLAAIESHDESFVWVTDGLVTPPAQGGGQLSIAGAQVSLPNSPSLPTITFKLGRWFRNSELGGMTFE